MANTTLWLGTLSGVRLACHLSWRSLPSQSCAPRTLLSVHLPWVLLASCREGVIHEY